MIDALTLIITTFEIKLAIFRIYIKYISFINYFNEPNYKSKIDLKF